MKKLSLILLYIFAMSLSAYAQDYYWYKGKQIPLQRGNQRYIIYEDNNAKGFDSLRVLETGDIATSKHENLKWAIVDQEAIITAKNVVYQTPSFLSADKSRNMFVTHRFYVKLKKEEDLASFYAFVSKYNVTIEQKGDFPLWYIMRCNSNSKHNALELANEFYESGNFAATEPEFINAVKFNCVNDTLFQSQWNLKNIGQQEFSSEGIDINYCAAREITRGDSTVVIGVYDLGLDLTHPDLNIYSVSYDVPSHISHSYIYTYNGNNNYHGTACAGIIGAKANNNLGVAGIAPNCPIMSISMPQDSYPYDIGLGFKNAADYGCSVISNSWSRDIYSPYIDEGISYALSQGRHGKGCVVVFAAGNNSVDSIPYPANSNDSILVVGAISPCGQRKNKFSCDGEYWWGGNYGNTLDVMAPGVKIRTTDNVGINGANSTDYMENFNGTSAACPHVAAIAGLILSVDSNLTQKEVADIIESTSRKVGEYSYTVHPNRPNGEWNYEMGYGLVDAYEAVAVAAGGDGIQELYYSCDTTKYFLWHAPAAGATISWNIINANSGLGQFAIIGSSTQDTVLVKRTFNLIPMTSTRNTSLNIPSISVSVINGGDSTVYNRPIKSMGDFYPHCTIDSSDTWYVGNSRTFTVTNCLNLPDSAFLWVAKRRFSNTTTTYRGRTFTYTPLSSGKYTISVTNTNAECGYATINYILDVDYNLSLNTSLNNDQLNITLVEEGEDSQIRGFSNEQNNNYTLELWHAIYGRVHTQTMQSNSVQIGTNNLPQGTYVVVLKDNGEVVAQTKVQI